MVELIPTTIENVYKISTVHAKERFTSKCTEVVALYYKHTKKYCYSMLATMVTMTSNSEVGVSKEFLQDNGERFTCN